MKELNDIYNDYQLIPMAEIDDEARQIAVRWVEDLQDAGTIEQKHKLASDIINYARRKAKVFSSSMLSDSLPPSELIILKKYHDEQLRGCGAGCNPVGYYDAINDAIKISENIEKRLYDMTVNFR